MKQNSKTPMIKSKAYNQIQRYFQSRKVYNSQTKKYEPLDPLSALSDQEKFEAIKAVMEEAVTEMYKYRVDRRKKRKVQKMRQESGYKPKKKTSLKEYQSMQLKQPSN